jgi:hypothetical protein
MLDVLREHLLERPDQYLGEMAVFLWDEPEALVTTSTISKALLGRDRVGVDGRSP